MSKKISLGVAFTIALVAMAVTFSLTMVISMNMFNSTVSSVKDKERQYNKLSEIDRFVRANEYFDINEDTIADNIAYGKPDATREEIVDAAKRARAHSFICRLPQGYDTVVAEDGGNISQGQRQLLCIARVMLRRPPILILDEATSSIDTRTEVLVQDAFEELMKGRTSFIVAHRLSTIKNADQILVMKAGNIIERGTHDELLARGGFYANLYESQFAKA